MEGHFLDINYSDMSTAIKKKKKALRCESQWNLWNLYCLVVFGSKLGQTKHFVSLISFQECDGTELLDWLFDQNDGTVKLEWLFDPNNGNPFHERTRNHGNNHTWPTLDPNVCETLWKLCFYCIVHPWHIQTCMSLFTQYNKRLPFVWSGCYTHTRNNYHVSTK